MTDINIVSRYVSAEYTTCYGFQTAARGQATEAIQLLTTYLSIYSNDVGAWEELASMYLQVQPLT